MENLPKRDSFTCENTIYNFTYKHIIFMQQQKLVFYRLIKLFICSLQISFYAWIKVTLDELRRSLIVSSLHDVYNMSDDIAQPLVI